MEGIFLLNYWELNTTIPSSNVDYTIQRDFEKLKRDKLVPNNNCQPGSSIQLDNDLANTESVHCATRNPTDGNLVPSSSYKHPTLTRPSCKTEPIQGNTLML